MSPTLILGQKVLMVRPKIALFIPTQIRHLTPRLGFIWYVCIPPPLFLLQPFFGVTIPHNPLEVPIKVVFTCTPSAPLYVGQPFFLAKFIQFSFKFSQWLKVCAFLDF
jgi:hypothetical protein